MIAQRKIRCPKSRYSSKESRAGETSQSVVGSNVRAVIVDSGSSTIVGSNIHGDTDVQITADMGDVQILSAANTTETFSFDESKTVGLGDIVDGLAVAKAQSKTKMAA